MKKHLLVRLISNKPHPILLKRVGLSQESYIKLKNISYERSNRNKK